MICTIKGDLGSINCFSFGKRAVWCTKAPAMNEVGERARSQVALTCIFARGYKEKIPLCGSWIDPIEE